jgi:hypothetical protein
MLAWQLPCKNVECNKRARLNAGKVHWFEDKEEAQEYADKKNKEEGF